jgi:DNA-binding MarR family transcriptional regulator
MHTIGSMVWRWPKECKIHIYWRRKKTVKREISQLREALLDLTGVLNRPQPDAALIALAGVDLDRALFPLLMRVERRGPLGIGELAELCGRDYTTVSRQVTKLDESGLVARQVNGDDARIKEVVITPKGREMTKALDGARQKIVASLLADWDKQEIAELARLLRKLADEALEFVRAEKSRSP